jgi:hypothetical protein
MYPDTIPNLHNLSSAFCEDLGITLYWSSGIIKLLLRMNPSQHRYQVVRTACSSCTCGKEECIVEPEIGLYARTSKAECLALIKKLKEQDHVEVLHESERHLESFYTVFKWRPSDCTWVTKLTNDDVNLISLAHTIN